MSPLVRIWIWIIGRTEQVQIQDSIMDHVTVFTIIHKCYSVIMVGKVSVFMANHFKLGLIPAGVAVGVPFYIPVLNIKGSTL